MLLKIDKVKIMQGIAPTYSPCGLIIIKLLNYKPLWVNHHTPHDTEHVGARRQRALLCDSGSPGRRCSGQQRLELLWSFTGFGF